MNNDNGHRKVASHILDTARKVVTTERGNQHGGAEDSFAMIAALWTTYLNNANNKIEVFNGVSVTAYDVAQMMTLLKVARAVHGNPLNEDNYVDASGYQSLAAAIAGVKTPEDTKADEIRRVEDAATRALANKLAPREVKPVQPEGSAVQFIKHDDYK